VSNAVATGSTAVAGVGGTGDLGHNGTAGGASTASLFNYAGTANGSAVAGPSTLLDAPAVPVPALSTGAMVLLAVSLALFGWLRMRGQDAAGHTLG
jgi:hypothetical protein